ncbi:MAG: Uma2 family endonuclease [Planctomycetes bacterium]|nr:Uma2 family endonuclease [Planctomycetota bacterium]
MATEAVTTADDLLRYCESGRHEPGRHELVRGELRSMSAAGWWHGLVVGWVHGQLDKLLAGNRTGFLFGAETGFVLARNPDTVRAPDVAFVTAARIPPLDRGFFEGPPDLAIEVTSPSDSFATVHEKALAWLDHGTPLVWVVEPKAGTVSVYRARDDVRILAAGDTLTGDDVLPGLALPVAELFPPAR